jgi:hypothetical protein
MILRYLRRYDFRGAVSVEGTGSLGSGGGSAATASGVAVADMMENRNV